MAIVARGTIADTGEDTFTSSMHHEYILADEQGHEIHYLLQGAYVIRGAHLAVQGKLTEKVDKYLQ